MSADVKAAIRLLEEALQQKNSESEAIDEGVSSNKSIVSSKKSVCVKLLENRIAKSLTGKSSNGKNFGICLKAQLTKTLIYPRCTSSHIYVKC